MLGLALQGPSMSAGLHVLAGAAKPSVMPEIGFPENLVSASATSNFCTFLSIFFFMLS